MNWPTLIIRAAAGCLLAIGSAAAGGAAPSFVPRPGAVYEGFVAINGPRADVPVGALWIDGYGPHGDPAAPDNLEVVRGLSGITINRDLELRLTAGLLGLLGIDPSLRRQFQARFSDLSIVRVKDVSKLAGPSGEPRIIEALKAGSVTVTTDNGGGLGIPSGSALGQFTATLSSDGRRAFTIEGRDMFVAMRVARSMETRSRPEVVSLVGGEGRLSGEADSLHIVARVQGCNGTAASECSPVITWQPRARASLSPEEGSLPPDLKQALDVPIADGRGGIYTHAEARFVAPCRTVKSSGCGSTWRALLTLSGNRVDDVAKPDAPRW